MKPTASVIKNEMIEMRCKTYHATSMANSGENRDLKQFFRTLGGIEPDTDYQEKALDPQSLFGKDYQIVEHFYSDAVNKGVSLFRYYLHVTKSKCGIAFLWLSYRSYKTCREGHTYFQVFPLNPYEEMWEAKWRNSRFLIIPSFEIAYIDTDNQSDDFDPWFATTAKSRKTIHISLMPGKIPRSK